MAQKQPWARRAQYEWYRSSWAGAGMSAVDHTRVQGIESYNEGLDPIKSFMRWEQQLPQLIRKLRTQHVHYALSIRYLLEPITSEVELSEMLADPGSSQKLWKSKDMANRLQDRLQESYQAYHSTITDIERITKLIASKLDLDRADELTRNDLEAIVAANPKKGDKFELRKRIRFGMSKKTIKGLLNELDECNKELERFSEKTEKIQTYRKSVKPSNATRVRRLQGYAKSLHDSLTLCWSCACKSSHKSSLQLDPRGDLFATGGKKVTASSKISFNLSFSTPNVDNKQTPWSWRAAEICVEDETNEDNVNLTPMSSPKPKMTKTVSFGTLPPYSILDPVTGSASPLQEVKDLCASIQQLKGSSTIGFSLDSKNILRGVYPIDTVRTVVPSSEPVSLEDLLDRRPVVGGKRAKLSKRDRYSLALTLASSVLYLNSTPWLTNQWTVKDILFHRNATTTTTLDIDIEHPYVAPAVVELTTVQRPRSWNNKNTILLALAIALLELYFGTTAEKYQEAEHGATDPALHQNPWLLCSMVHTWAEDAQDDLSAAFLSAVRHCLHCFSEPGASLQDAEFLQAAVEGIVLPLQEELSHFLGKTVT
ncbi:hypothetical protein T440DRAFT_486957 [Plenodomus tracheiphilus IPT5]|uniref:DUF7580 domain-containing protein n=1 Tax=Plenodomus tracheiphilus IPT5 TaxID=1408161 RepID=A0A6A7BJ32_9PLEO|nr:hypothetical protein T440DRAFT_486957 [Plenodomus tracheiphilus IPT5]